MAKQAVKARKSRTPVPPQALYERVKDYIMAQIQNGALKPGDRLPSELELVKAVGVSRMTANRAVRELFSQGVLTRIAGVGTFVAARGIDEDLLEVRSIAAEIRERGGYYSSKLHKIGKVTATAAAAAGLGVAPGSIVFHSVIVHCENDVPVQLEDRFVNPSTVPDYLDIDFSTLTPYEYLCQIAPITDVEHIIEAILPDKRVQNLLNVPASEPCLRLYRATSSFRRKLTCVWLTYAGHQHRMAARFSLPRIRSAKRP